MPAYACESMCLSGEEVLEILDEMEGKLTECQYMTFMTLYSVSKELAAAGNAAAPLDIWNE